MSCIALKTRNEADRIALRGLHLRSRLAALGQQTTIEQTFLNLEDRTIEAVYTFPLPDNAAVCHFEVLTGERVLTARIEEAQKAEDLYDEAVTDGHGAMLLEQDRPNVFTINVGNLKPGQAVTIRLTYVAELEITDRVIRLAYPTTVAPRYVTATDTDPLQAARDQDKLNPPHVLCVPYGLAMEIETDLDIPVGAVESTSHAIIVTRCEGGRTRITLADTAAQMDRDVVMTLELQHEPDPHVRTALGPDGRPVLALSLVPAFDGSEQARHVPEEVLFVLDCSGSMQGDSIEQARRALELCLRTLAEGDRFNICRFGSTFELMSPRPLVYSGQSLRQALGYVQAVHANLGGTELLPPLQAIFKQPPAAGDVRQIVLLTDGQLGNEEAVIDLARRHRQSNRIFTFGIGWASSSYLVRGLARATGGAAEFVTAGERIEDKVLRTFGRMASPLVGDIQLDCAGAELTLADPDSPPLFEGDALTLLARASGPLPQQVLLKMSTPGGPVSWTVPVPQPEDDGGLIATLWARRRIEYLEQDRPREGRFAPRERRQAKQLIQLSKDFGLLCSLTSFLAVEHRTPEDRDDGQPELRRVPVQLARGWGGFDVTMACVSHARFSSERRLLASPLSARRRLRADVAGAGPTLFCAAAHGTPASDVLLDLLAAQQADGHFRWAPEVGQTVQYVRLSVERLRPVLRSRLEQLLGELPPDADRIVDTLAVLIVLEQFFAERRPQWKRAAKKARRFVEAAAPAADLNQLLKL